jgi:HD superfamily phosphohydrolase
MADPNLNYYDSLYGQVSFRGALAELIGSPVLQRMRHVRLSNIDSIAMPGIANLSRYEHVLGVGYLAQHVGLLPHLRELDRLALGAAALLHDWIITAFGHLVEEAFKYLDTGFDHESRMQELLSHDEALGEIGFLDRQILGGRQTNLRPWAKRSVGDFEADLLLDRIMEAISGRGPLGRLISGEMDLDNIDNVYRMAYHMGMPVDRSLPLRLASGIVGIATSGNPIFRQDVENDVASWLDTRAQVYSRLMPAEPDFAMKMMIIFAAIEAQKVGEIRASDWHMTDSDFVSLLLKSKSSAARDTMERWLSGEFWAAIPLQWISGQRPTYPDLLSFSAEVSVKLNRQCFAYGIKDKRHRFVEVEFDNGLCRSFGKKPNAWLFGLGSPKRQVFTNSEVKIIIDLLNKRFHSEALGAPDDLFAAGPSSEDHACLL